MALYAEQSPKRAMLNSQRLSAMIDSFNENEGDDHILNMERANSSKKDRHEIEHLGTPSNFKEPTKNTSSPSGVSSLSANNRHSMISDYSGVLHEGVEVSYIVQNQNNKSIEHKGPSLPALPSQQELAEREEVFVQTIPNAKLVGRLNSTTSTSSASSNYSEKTKIVHASGSDSLRLLPVSRRQMAASSIGSGNLASESGSSYYHHIKGEEKNLPILRTDSKTSKEEHTDADNNTNNATGTDSSDNYSIATSIIPPLSTNVQSDNTGILPVRSETNSYNPTIPPRNKNRPNSRLFIRDSLDDIENQLMEQMKDPVTMIKNSNEITRASSSTNKSDTYFSATSFPDTEDNDIHDGIKHTEQEDRKYLERPLPTAPDKKGVDRDSTLRAESSKSRQSATGQDTTKTADYEDQYEDIDNFEDLSLNQAPKKGRNVSQKATKKGKPTKTKNDKKRQEIRSFDVDTISQMLNVTKGTLIGAEFANLGMKVEEKRALERLVDSLSRLTADMVLDPERYQEGLKRLDKATRALEGF